MNNNSYYNYNTTRRQPQKASGTVPAIIGLAVSGLAVLLGLAAVIYAGAVLGSKGNESTPTASYTDTGSISVSVSDNNAEAAPTEVPAAAPTDAPAETDTAAADNAAADELLSAIGGKEYLYASGAGGWSESLTIYTDGTFSGSTADSDIGIATIWKCDFTGTFGNVTKISDYEYTIEVISLDAPAFNDYADEGMTYSYTAPYGIAQGTVYHVYLPGMPVSEMPEDFTDMLLVSSVIDGAQTFPCCGLYSTTAGWYCE